MDGEKPRKRGGRPPLLPSERKTTTRTFRIRPDLDTELVAAAEAGGRSISEEIERRLDATLRSMSLYDAVFSSALGQEMAAMAQTVRGIEKVTGKSPVVDAFTAVAIRAALRRMLDDIFFRTAPISAAGMPDSERARAEQFGQLIVRAVNPFAASEAVDMDVVEELRKIDEARQSAVSKDR